MPKSGQMLDAALEAIAAFDREEERHRKAVRRIDRNGRLLHLGVWGGLILANLLIWWLGRAS